MRYFGVLSVNKKIKGCSRTSKKELLLYAFAAQFCGRLRNDNNGSLIRTRELYNLSD